MKAHSFERAFLFLNSTSNMSASGLFKKYVWLVDTIRRERRISLADLNERWQRTELSEGTPLSRTSFNRHRTAVEEIFGIIIGCDADNRYYIIDSGQIQTDTVQQWMLSTLTVSNIIGDARNLHDRILLENIPIEGELLRQVVEAMQRSVKVKLEYRRYGVSTNAEWIAEPYCIKLFRRRWYMLGRLKNGTFIVFSFDRITSLHLTDESFSVAPDFDAEAYFSNYFGVMTDDRLSPQRIVIRAFGNERFAMRSLPIHSSQKVLEEHDDHIDFEVCICPTTDFFAHILSRGKWVKIISPESIAQAISDLHNESIK